LAIWITGNMQKTSSFSSFSASATRLRVRRVGRLWAVAAAICLTFGASGQAKITPDVVEIDVPVYQIGEQVIEPVEEIWNFKFAWSGFPVGTISISGKSGVGDTESLLGVNVDGRTNTFIDLLWRYRLTARGTIHLDPFAPRAFVIEENEKRRQKTTKIEFEDGAVHSTKRKGEEFVEFNFEAPNTYDIISAVYLMMHLEYHVGREYSIDALTGTSRYLVSVEVEDREFVKVMGRMVEAYRLLIHTTDLTDPEDDLKHAGTYMWVSTAPPRRMLKAQAKTKWGSIYGELDSIFDSRAPADAPIELFPFEPVPADVAKTLEADKPRTRSANSSSPWRGKPHAR
jgi:hypothetical protein